MFYGLSLVCTPFVALELSLGKHHRTVNGFGFCSFRLLSIYSKLKQSNNYYYRMKQIVRQHFLLMEALKQHNLQADGSATNFFLVRFAYSVEWVLKKGYFALGFGLLVLPPFCGESIVSVAKDSHQQYCLWLDARRTPLMSICRDYRRSQTSVEMLGWSQVSCHLTSRQKRL